MLRNIKLIYYALIFSFINLILYQFPFYNFIFNNIEATSANGIFLIISITIAALFLNGLVFYIGLYLLRSVGKWILVLFFNINAIAVYFINTYGVIIDKTIS